MSNALCIFLIHLNVYFSCCNYTLQISYSSKPFITFFLFTLKYAHPPPTHTENINMIQLQIMHIPAKTIAIIINAFDILSSILIPEFEYDLLLRERTLCLSSISEACNPFKYILSKPIALATMYFCCNCFFFLINLIYVYVYLMFFFAFRPVWYLH